MSEMSNGQSERWTRNVVHRRCLGLWSDKRTLKGVPPSATIRRVSTVAPVGSHAEGLRFAYSTASTAWSISFLSAAFRDIRCDFTVACDRTRRERGQKPTLTTR